MFPAPTPFLCKKERTDFAGQLSVFATNLILLDAFYHSFIHLYSHKTFIENLVSGTKILAGRMQKLMRQGPYNEQLKIESVEASLDLNYAT